jgi:protein-S-isoprenylcysteine O-methyltransferase Ste14
MGRLGSSSFVVAWGIRCSREEVRRFLEAVLAAVLFGSQSIVDAGWAISVVSMPLLPCLVCFLRGQANPGREVQALFFSREFLVGRVIALIGFMVLLLAAVQFLWNRASGVGLVRTGAYCVVRHPEFTGIIIVTAGLTVMVLTLGGNQLQIMELWMMQVLGYIGIARYEETHLLNRFGEGFSRYKRDVPLMFPIKCPSRISETVFTVMIAVLICCFLSLFLYDLIRIH